MYLKTAFFWLPAGGDSWLSWWGYVLSHSFWVIIEKQVAKIAHLYFIALVSIETGKRATLEFSRIKNKNVLLSTLPPSGNRCSLQVDMLPEIPMVCQYIEWFVVTSPSPNGWITWLVVHPIKVTLTCCVLVQHVMTWKKGPGPSLTSIDIWSAHYTDKLKLLRT